MEISQHSEQYCNVLEVILLQIILVEKAVLVVAVVVVLIIILPEVAVQMEQVVVHVMAPQLDREVSFLNSVY